MNLIPLLVLAGIGAWAVSKRGSSVTASEPVGSPGAWTVSPVPVAATPEAARAREDGITKVLQSASKTGNQILIAFPLRRGTPPGAPALASGAELLGYGVAQRIAQEGGERAYYVKLTSLGQLAGGKPAELSERVLDLPAIGTDYRITNAHLASIQELETLTPETAPEPAPRTTTAEPSPASIEPAIVKRTPVPESRRFFPAAHFGGARDPSRIRVIVLHSTEGGSAGGAASWFQNEASGGSTQLVAGEDGLFRSVDDLRIPWGAEGANSDGLHIELAGYAKWTREQWLAREKTLENAASAIGQWSKKYGIPLRYIEGAELADDVTRGVTTHVAVTKAYKKGDHWDPGPGFPVDVLLERAKAYA